MRTIPRTPGEQLFSDIIELIGNKKKYDERFKELEKIKDEAAEKCVELDEKASKIDAWERDHERKVKDLEEKEAKLSADQTSLKSAREHHRRDTAETKRELAKEQEALETLKAELKKQEEQIEERETKLERSEEELEESKKVYEKELSQFEAKKKRLDALMRE